jgi:2-oxoisovalerate dehydrogenase E1 component alpha subunit
MPLEVSMMVQLLAPTGERVPDPQLDPYLEGVDLAGLYRDMVLVRRIDTEATALQRQGELGLWASPLGQEATQIGSARAMRDTDFAFPTYREVGVTWARGVDPVSVLRLYRGVTNGGWDPRQHNCNPFTIVIGNQALHGVGYAMGITLDGADDAAIAYFGDGATTQGDVNEALIFASLFAAPVILFCTNNGWAISHPFHLQSPTQIVDRAAGFGMPAVQVDGNDVLAVYAVTSQALAHARSGQGPTLIDAVTYRMGAHTTSDDPSRYRDPGEAESWQSKDPLLRLRTYLENTSSLPDDFWTALDAEGDALAERIRTGVRAMTVPPGESMFEHVLVESNPALDAQRTEFLAYESQFEEQL